MRLWLLLAVLAGCGDDRLPDFATGQPTYGFDASTSPPLDASAPADADAAQDG